MDAGELCAGDVLIRARYSGINFKDALAVSGRGKILRRFPLNAGIDVAGVVETTTDARFAPGDAVLVNGMGLGESHDGGFAEYVRVPGDWIVPLPAGLTLREAMALGTAGFTAALALHRMEQLGQRPEQGPIVVTGASGGVGSIAVSILARRGYAVTAVSGRAEHAEYLRRLGASEVATPETLGLGTRALESARFGGAVDNVGGELLAGLTRHVGLWGQIACVGNAAGPELSTTVFPLILRGVSLLGISSANCPMPLRTEVWNRLGAELKPPRLESIVSHAVPLAEVFEAASLLMERKAHGRILVDCGGEAGDP
jgi:putative YhdH/YhfP family quinone oxidoreductase